MDNDFKIIAVFMVFVLGCSFFVARYKYTDCKKVGHTTTYCVLDTFK